MFCMPNATIHQATTETSWRILCLLRFGEVRIHLLKLALDFNESTFSHALSRLESRGLVATRQSGREKLAHLSDTGRIALGSLQALCCALYGHDGSRPAEDERLRELSVNHPPETALEFQRGSQT